MIVTRLDLKNFRNYEAESVELSPGRNILIGENAQGKTNFLEAIELVSKGYSDRAKHDYELLRQQSESMEISLSFQTRYRPENIHLRCHLVRGSGKRTGRLDQDSLEKSITINGVKHARMKALTGHLATVSFKSSDVNLLRGGPKYRRDWIDHIAVNTRPGLRDVYAKYAKVVSQRNRLLRLLYEKGTVSTSAREELKVWDQQAAFHGAKIIVGRLGALAEIRPLANNFQQSLSGQQENLSIRYQFKTVPTDESSESEENLVAAAVSESSEAYAQGIKRIVHGGETGPIESAFSSESEFHATILKTFQDRRYEEISRRQTLCGPHRDDLSFCLNDQDATAYASQGQQRSLVLSLKLAELKLLSERLEETPILILDDVLAELDLSRQSLLMSLVKGDMQTIISTTHLSGFCPEWLQDAQLLRVTNGRLLRISEEQALPF